MSYPGQDTNFFYIKDGQPCGPFIGLEQLSHQSISPDTPVWYDGLDDWKPAVLAPLTRQLFFGDSDFYRNTTQNAEQPAAEPPQIVTPDSPPVDDRQEDNIDAPEPPGLPDAPQHEAPGTEPAQEPQPENQLNAPQIPAQPQNAYNTYVPPVPAEPKPYSYLVWALVVTLLCNIVTGVIAIIYSCKVSSRYYKGDIAGAKKASETTQWWIAISICTGLIFTVFNLFTGSFL